MVGYNTLEIQGMRDDFERAHLIMSCTIERLSTSGTDPDGKPVGTWNTLHSGLDCWYWEQDQWRTSLQEHTGPQVNVIDAFPKLIVPAGTDVVAGDRVVSIIGVDGVEVTPVNGDIRTVLRKLWQTVLTLEQQT